MNIKAKHCVRLLSRLGKGSLLLGAAAVTGLSLRAKYGTWKGRLSANFESHLDYPWDFNWDKRGTSKSTANKKQTTSKRHILLIRHGQYDTNGETDIVRNLTDTGRFQAMITGQRLNDLSLPYLKIISSTMTRAQETAQLIKQGIVYPDLKLEYDDILEEGAPVDPIPPSENWSPHPSQFFQDSARIESAFRKYFHRADQNQLEDSYEVIVCHANVIRFFVCRALQFPLSGWIRISIANCSLTMITIHPDGLVVVEMMGDHGHIPPDSVTFH